MSSKFYPTDIYWETFHLLNENYTVTWSHCHLLSNVDDCTDCPFALCDIENRSNTLCTIDNEYQPYKDFIISELHKYRTTNPEYFV